MIGERSRKGDISLSGYKYSSDGPTILWGREQRYLSLTGKKEENAVIIEGKLRRTETKEIVRTAGRLARYLAEVVSAR